MVDLTKIRSIEDLLALSDDADMYDDTPEDDEESPYKVELQPGLTAAQIQDAKFWEPYSRGVMVIDGAEGGGKGVVGNMIMWKMRRYFGKNILLDYKPRRLFGPYVPFREDTFADQLSRMGELAGWKKPEDDGLNSSQRHELRLIEDAVRWIAVNGQVFLYNACMGLDEWPKYHDFKRPHNPMGVLLQQLYRIWRHLDLLVVGMCIDTREIDKRVFPPKITTEIRCQWSQRFADTCVADVIPYKSVSHSGVRRIAGPSTRLFVNGRKHRPELGCRTCGHHQERHESDGCHWEGCECQKYRPAGWFNLYRSKNPVAIPVPRSIARQ